MFENTTIMHISKTKFILFFCIFGFTFLFVTTSLLGSTGPRGFPKSPDSILRTGDDSPMEWKRIISRAIFPIKVILIGPIAFPSVHFLKEDPPPPFIGIYLISYWTMLTHIFYFFLKIWNKNSCAE